MNKDTQNSSLANGIEVPHEKLSEDALHRVIESFILREGTDYGVHEVSLEAKINQVRKQLEKREVVILFDPESESLTLVTKQELRAIRNR